MMIIVRVSCKVTHFSDLHKFLTGISLLHIHTHYTYGSEKQKQSACLLSIFQTAGKFVIFIYTH